MAIGSTTDVQLEQFVADVRQGVEGAREPLLEHANNRLLRLTRHMLRNYPALRRWETTDDVQQNAFVRLYRSLALQVLACRYRLDELITEGGAPVSGRPPTCSCSEPWP